MPIEVLAHPRTDLVPLTDTQAGVWFTEMAGGNGSAYHVGLCIDLHGDLDTAALDRAVAAVVVAHPVLAADLFVAEGRPYLRPGRHAIRVERTDADVVALAKTVERFVAAPMLLDGSQPLVRFTLLRVDACRHVLVFSAHHLVFDGVSKDVLVRSLAETYSSRPVPNGRYAHAVHAEMDQSQRQAETAREHWAGWEPPTELRLPHVRLTASGSPAATDRVDVPVSVTVQRGLDTAVDAIGSTRFEFLQAAVHALFHRYGNDVVSVAIDVTTRTPTSTDVIGMFVNELPLTTAYRPSLPFAEFAGRLRAQARPAYALRAVPVARATTVRPGTALGPVSVSYRRQTAIPRFDGLRTEVEWAPPGVAARSPIHFHITDTDAGPRIRLSFDATKVDRPIAEAVAIHLANLLEHAVRAPHTPIGQLDPCGADERSQVTGSDPKPATTLTRMVAEARSTGPAIIADDGRRSYDELHSAAARLAHWLAGLGIGPGHVVGLCAGRGLGAMVGLLAIVKAGAAYLPLDPSHPPARIRYVLDDADPALVLCTPDAQPALGDAPVSVQLIDTEPPQENPGDPIAGTPGPLDPAYIMYTSGSTGRPKGVTISQQAIANLLRAMAAEMRVRPGAAWLWLTPLTFDISTVECFVPLLAGGRIVVPSSAQSHDGTALAHLVREHGVTHVQTTPSRWELILSTAPDDPAWSGVTALCGGEPLPPMLAGRLLSRVARLVNVYGPTETTVWSTISEVTTVDAITIGRPIAGTTAYVLDARMSMVPAGVDGRLCLSGIGLASHYHARPALTAEHFLPDPFGPPGSRLYLTGDNARVGRDGSLVGLGRDDHQVKIRGHRVELGEIEARLCEHPSVTASVVTVDSAQRLIAYVTGTPVPDRELREHLATTLPVHMIPAVFVALDGVPLTPHGKVDRAALPQPTADLAPAPPEADDLTEAVRRIWCEALQTESVGVHDDLFALGGHSLIITQIAARIRDRFGVDIPVFALWDAPTVAETVVAIRAAVKQ